MTGRAHLANEHDCVAGCLRVELPGREQLHQGIQCLRLLDGLDREGNLFWITSEGLSAGKELREPAMFESPHRLP